MPRSCSKSNCSTSDTVREPPPDALPHGTPFVPTIALQRYDTLEASDVHDFHQIVLGIDGAMVMAVDGVSQRLDRHGAWLVPAGARHDYAGLGENRQLVLNLPLASLAVPQRLFDSARAVAIDPALTSLVAQIAAAAAQLDAPADDARHAAAHRFQWQAAARCVARCSTNAPSPRPPQASISRASTAGCAHGSRSRCASPISPRTAATGCAAFINYSSTRSAKPRIATCSGSGSTRP